MEFFSRTHELREVERKVSGQHGDAIVLTGPRGSGKTAILRALSASTRLPLVIVRGGQTESAWPKSGLFAFLASLDATLGTGSEAAVAELLRHGPNASSYALTQAIEAELRVSQCGDFLVLIDDVDLLDRSSQNVLGTAMRLLTRAGMRSVATVSGGSTGGLFPDISKLVLKPLDTLSLIRLAETLSPPTASASVLEHVARASGGSPLALKSILSALPAPVVAGEAAIPCPIKTGRALDEIVRHELEDLDDAELVVLQFLACADYLPAEVFHRLSELSLDALDALQASGLVQREGDRLFISTQALSASVYWAMGARMRLRLHDEIATAIANDHAGLQAWHTSFVQLDTRHSAALLEAAIDEAARGKVRAAIAFAERGISLGDAQSNAKHLARLSKLMLRNAHFALARRYLEFARADESSDTPHPSHTFLTIILDYVEDQRLAPQVFGPILREHAETAPIDCVRMLGVGAICHLERWELPAAELLLESAREILPDHNPFLDAVETLVDLYRSVFLGEDLPGVTGLGRQINTIRDGIGPETALILVARVLSLAEQHIDARVLLREFTSPVRSEHRIWTLLALQVELSNEIRAGRYHRARHAFNRFDAAFRQQRHFEVNHAYAASLIASLDGDLDAASSEVRRARLMVQPGTAAAQEAQISVRQARVATSQRNFDCAAGHYRRAHNASNGLKNPALLRFHCDYVLVLARTGQLDAAREVLDELRRLSESYPSAWASRAIEICEAMLMPGEEGIQAFRDLLDRWDDGHQEYLRARALFAFADRLRELGYESESSNARDTASEVFREIGIDRGDGTCLVPGSAPETASILSLLTDKELAVVRLLARGAKNQAIAHELYVSVRTVELRLTNIFRKVGVKSRFDLMKRVTPELEAQDGLAPGPPPSLSRFQR